jgi:hypothetical protein
MTTHGATTAQPPPHATGAPPRRRRRGGPVLLGAIGAVVVALGGIAAAAAVGLLAVFGSAGALDSGEHPVSGTGAALVSDVSHIQNTRGVGPVTGWPSLRVTAHPAAVGDVFVGIAPADAVDRYLAGVATDRVTDLTLRPFRLTVAPRAGAAIAAKPADQGFWVATATSDAASGTPAELTWQVRDGDYRLVVMNADGASQVSARARVALHLPHAFAGSLALLGGALGVIVIGSGLVVVAAIGSRRI